MHWFPIIDGHYFTGQPLVLALKVSFRHTHTHTHIPVACLTPPLQGAVHANAVLIGTNSQEGSVFVYPQFNYQQLTVCDPATHTAHTAHTHWH